MPRTPLALRKLKAQMVLKALDLKALAEKAGVDYSVASAVLKGSRRSPRTLHKLQVLIERAPMPSEAAV